jgi:hypothetical protein
VPPPALSGIAADLDQELLPDNPEKTFDLAAALGLTGQSQLCCG